MGAEMGTVWARRTRRIILEPGEPLHEAARRGRRRRRRGGSRPNGTPDPGIAPPVAATRSDGHAGGRNSFQRSRAAPALHAGPSGGGGLTDSGASCLGATPLPNREAARSAAISAGAPYHGTVSSRTTEGTGPATSWQPGSQEPLRCQLLPESTSGAMRGDARTRIGALPPSRVPRGFFRAPSPPPRASHRLRLHRPSARERADDVLSVHAFGPGWGVSAARVGPDDSRDASPLQASRPEGFLVSLRPAPGSRYPPLP
jgi:hypothetical protein